MWPLFAAAVAWAAPDRDVYYTVFAPSHDPEVWRTTTDGAAPTKVTDGFAIARSPSGERLAVSTLARSLEVIDTGGTVLGAQKLELHTTMVAFVDDDSLVYADLSGDDHLVRWDLDAPEVRTLAALPLLDRLLRFGEMPDGRLSVAAGGGVFALDVDSGATEQLVDARVWADPLPDGRWLVSDKGLDEALIVDSLADLAPPPVELARFVGLGHDVFTATPWAGGWLETLVGPPPKADERQREYTLRWVYDERATVLGRHQRLDPATAVLHEWCVIDERTAVVVGDGASELLRVDAKKGTATTRSLATSAGAIVRPLCP